MNITLTPQLRAYVEEQVKSGRFESPNDAINDAVRLLQQKEKIGAQIAPSRVQYDELGGMADSDIMALAFIVMMEAAKSAREDLKAIMDGVKAINNAKQAWREVISQVGRDVAENPCYRAEARPLKFSSNGVGSEAAYHRLKLPHLDPDAEGGVRFVATDVHKGKIVDPCVLAALYDELKGKLDSMSETGEMESLRLPMAMDRMSKMMSTLSNLLKKQSDTAQSIIDNLK
jgi:putative addiction module CopG family antidote